MTQIFLVVCDDRDYDSGSEKVVASFYDEALAASVSEKLDDIANDLRKTLDNYMTEHRQHHPDRRALEYKAAEDMAVVLQPYNPTQVYPADEHRPAYLGTDAPNAYFGVEVTTPFKEGT